MHQFYFQVDNLKVSFKTYAGEVQSVRGINFEVKKGEILSIIGPTGSGKTEILKMIADYASINESHEYANILLKCHTEVIFGVIS